MSITKKELQLYAVTDRRWADGDFLEDVKAALEGGVTCLQMREKILEGEARKAEATRMQALCKEYGVPFIVNDDPMLAKEIDADGVHVGPNDMPVAEVRKLLGPDKIIGASARTVQAALLAEAGGADYLGVGAVFGTGTKEDASKLDLSVAKKIATAVTIPMIAIGGVTAENVAELAGCGFAGVAVVSAVFAQDNILEKTKALKQQVLQMIAK